MNCFCISDCFTVYFYALHQVHSGVDAMQGVYARNVGRRPRMQDACSLHASLVSVWPGIKLAIRLFTS